MTIDTEHARRCREGKAFWTPERDDQLRDLVQKGTSATRIGAIMGKSRNAIIGRARREGIMLAGTPETYAMAAKLRAQNKRRPGRPRKDDGPAPAPRPPKPEPPRKTEAPIPRVLEPVDAAPLVGAATSVLQLRGRACRWPIGEPGTDGFYFCSRPTGDVTLSYCPDHRRVATTGQGPKIKRAAGW